MDFLISFPPFTYKKFVVVVDSSINVKNPRQVGWVLTSEIHLKRSFVFENTPLDNIDFANENICLGGRFSIDATTKNVPEKNHDWGKPLN
tara:strand:+ start:619 stop:888 length:270 start_codon:yes stop_codon:yes gene_type:complete